MFVEQTKHYVTTIFIVHDNRTALHKHEKLGYWLPPGGHVDRNETPHQAGLREVREETGHTPNIIPNDDEIDDASFSSKLPNPQHLFLDNVIVTDGLPTHQHINFVYYGTVDSAEINPDGHNEAPPSSWEWFTIEELKELGSGYKGYDVDTGVISTAVEAIEEAENQL